MNKFLLTVIILVSSIKLSAQLQTDIYQYNIDLLNVQNDKVLVTLLPPKNQLQEGKFVMPRIVPGYYDALNLGQYISEFQAFNKKGENVSIKRLDTNSWAIPDLGNIAKITYKVSGGWNHLLQKTQGAKSPESMYKKDSVFIINYSSLVGYFEEITPSPYRITIKKDKGFYASSALKYIPQNDTTDIVSAADYRRLVDAPVLYCIPDTTWIQIGNASHEFFHVLTPLNIHSQEVQNFNFLHPVLSKHLWLYEGMTEYATIHMPIKQKMISIPAFLKTVEAKIKGMDGFNNKLSMTEMSTNAIKMQDQYMNFYQKGALLDLCLDIRLRALSKEKIGTQELMQKLIEKYGPEKAFKDEDLFNVITRLTFPEIRQFFKDYVEDGQPIPLKESLQKVGFDYNESQKTVTEINNPSEAQISLRKAWINQ